MKTSALSRMARRTPEPPISWLMQAALARRRLISLAAGFTDNPSLPVAETRAALNQILRSPKTGRPALQYGSTAGDPRLRQLTVSHLRKLDRAETPRLSPNQGRRRSVPPGIYDWERLLITSGSQQLLYLTAEALCDEGDIVLVEDPTYFVFLSILQSRGLRARGVRLERDGLDLAHLEKTLTALQRTGDLRRVRLFYLVSYFQNPTGVTTSFEKKRGLLECLKRFERAAGHPICLLEDAAYRELRFRGADVPSALAVAGAAGRVIYAGTFTKPFATGARVGYGLLPAPLFTAIRHLKGNHDFGTANLLQQFFARVLATGQHTRQVARLQTRYARKAQVMRLAIEKYFPPAVEWWEPAGGLYFWARLPRGISAGMKSKVFRTALRRDVIYVPGELCYADDPSRRKPNNEMRISFGNASEAEISEGIKRLGAVLNQLVK